MPLLYVVHRQIATGDVTKTTMDFGGKLAGVRGVRMGWTGDHFSGGCRGAQCSPVRSYTSTKRPGRIGNPPLRCQRTSWAQFPFCIRRGAFHMLPCSIAAAQGPYTAIKRLPLRGAGCAAAQTEGWLGGGSRLRDHPAPPCATAQLPPQKTL